MFVWGIGNVEITHKRGQKMADKEWLAERFVKENKYQVGYDEECGWLVKVEGLWCPDTELAVLWGLYVKLVRDTELNASLLRNHCSYRQARRLEAMVRNAERWRTFEAVLAEAQKLLAIKAIEGV